MASYDLSIPVNIVDYFQTEGRRNLSYSKILQHENPDRDHTIVISESYIFTRYQMHCLSKLFEWIFETAPNLKAVYFIHLPQNLEKDSRKFKHNTPYYPPDKAWTAGQIIDNIFEIASHRFKKNQPNSNYVIPEIYSQTEKNAHDRCITIYQESGLYRFELGRGIELFQTNHYSYPEPDGLKLENIKLEDLKTKKIRIQKLHFSEIKFNQNLSKQANQALFLKFFKHECQVLAAEWINKPWEKKINKINSN